MNIFSRELRAHGKGLLFWCIAMVLLVGSGIAKFYGYSTTGTSDFSGILSQFPHSLQVLFGVNGIDLSKPSGIYGILFMYIVLTATIHAVLLSTDLISKEERDKTAEFVFTKPVSRASVITAKLLAGLVNLVVLNIVTLITSIYAINYFSKSTVATNDVLLLTIALFILQLLFFLIGAAIAAVSKRPKAAASIASAILLITFILYYAINLSGHIDMLKYFTPFKYFEASVIITNNHLDGVYIALSASIMLATIALTYTVYQKRDLET